MPVKQKLILLLSLLLLLSVFLFVGYNHRQLRQQTLQTFAQAAQRTQKGFQADLDTTEVQMLQIANFVAADSQVQRLFLQGKRAVAEEGGGPGGPRAAQIRQELYALLAPSQAELKQRYGFRQLHFHLGPGSLSFLRVHQPDKFGDRMDQVRYTVVAANADRKEVKGFETGRVISGIRGVVPVFAQDEVSGETEHVGALEAGTSFDTLLLTVKKNRPGLDAAVLLRLDHLKANLWPDFLHRLLEENAFVRDFMVEATTSPLVLSILNQLPSSETRWPISPLLELGDTTYAVIAFPLRDYHGDSDPRQPDAGMVLLWSDAGTELAALHAAQKENLLAGLLFFVVCECCIVMGVRLVTRKLEVELAETQTLEALGRNAAQTAAQLVDSGAQHSQRLHQSLQLQLNEAVTAVHCQFGLYISADTGGGYYRVLAASDMVWSTASGHALYQQARESLETKGSFPVSLGDNQIVRALSAPGNAPLTLDEQFCKDHLSYLPEGHPPLHNLLLVPVTAGTNRLGLFVLANSAKGFGDEEVKVAKAYANAAALLMQTDRREVARLAAEEASRLKTEFLGTLSHELRTPLNTIFGLGQLLSDSPLDARQQEYLIRINGSSRALLALIDDILALAELDARAELGRQEAVDLDLLTRRLIGLFADAATAQGITLKRSVDAALPGGMLGQPTLLEQILQRLLSNAIKFSHGGEVSLALTLLNRQVDSAWVDFSVADQGIGIAEEVQASIFQPFFQVDSSSTRQYGGTGMGLALAQKLCRQLGGEIRVESAPGQGSRFSFQLKFPLAAEPQGQGPVPGAESPIPAAEPKRIPATTVELLQLLEQLDIPLSKLQPRPCLDIARRLGLQVWPERLAGDVEKLGRLLEAYRFSEAQGVVAQIRDQLK